MLQVVGGIAVAAAVGPNKELHNWRHLHRHHLLQHLHYFVPGAVWVVEGAVVVEEAAVVVEVEVVPDQKDSFP